MKATRRMARRSIHFRIRKKLKGTQDRPRMNIFRSAKHIYVQVIDDFRGMTLVSASTVDTLVRKDVRNGGNVEAAKLVGKTVAERALAKGIEKVVFDRGGYRYHGRIKALADAAREAGMKF